jgi:hypothetical protein
MCLYVHSRVQTEVSTKARINLVASVGTHTHYRSDKKDTTVAVPRKHLG